MTTLGENKVTKTKAKTNTSTNQPFKGSFKPSESGGKSEKEKSTDIKGKIRFRFRSVWMSLNSSNYSYEEWSDLSLSFWNVPTW